MECQNKQLSQKNSDYESTLSLKQNEIKKLKSFATKYQEAKQQVRMFCINYLHTPANMQIAMFICTYVT